MAILNPNYAFLEADYSNPNLCGNRYKPTENKRNITIAKATTISAPAFLLTIPDVALAASSFDNLYPTIMRLFDSGVVLVIVFAGAAWALGHRSKAIELLIGVCCGYLLARNAINFRDYLKSI